MIRGKKMKGLMMGVLVLVLIVSLVAGACAKAAPEGAAEEEIAALESELATEKAKVSGLEGDVSDLEDEIAELRTPGEVQRWEPATWQSAGMVWNGILHMADYINEASDGRIVVTPSAPGAICEIHDQLDAVSMGTTEMMVSYLGSAASGIIHLGRLFGENVFTNTCAEQRYLYEYYQDGVLFNMYQEKLEEYGVHAAGIHYFPCNNIIVSKVPINSLAEVEGVAFRSAGEPAETLAAFGAGTCYLPGPEIYTALATGAVDAVTYSNAADCLAVGFHEVTEYWVKNMLVQGPNANYVIINNDVWQALPDDLKAIVESAADAGSAYTVFEGEVEIGLAWNTVEDYGIELLVWPDEDCAAFKAKSWEITSSAYIEEPDYAAAVEIIEQFASLMGY